MRESVGTGLAYLCDGDRIWRLARRPPGPTRWTRWPGTNTDTITDFASRVDVIHLSAAVFGAFSGQVGRTECTGAKLSYHSASGLLAYDANGAGGASPVAFAILGRSKQPAGIGAGFHIIA